MPEFEDHEAWIIDEDYQTPDPDISELSGDGENAKEDNQHQAHCTSYVFIYFSLFPLLYNEYL